MDYKNIHICMGRRCIKWGNYFSELGPDVSFGPVDNVSLLGDTCHDVAGLRVEVLALHEVLVPMRPGIQNLQVDPIVHMGQLVKVDGVVKRNAETVAVQRQVVEVRDREQEVRIRKVRKGHVVVAGIVLGSNTLRDSVRMVLVQRGLVDCVLHGSNGGSHFDEVIQLIGVFCGIEHVLGELVLHDTVLKRVHVLAHGRCVLEPVR